ncbi:MAG: stalk domain-containing protein [Armatimonadota bacterium]|nr:stalk domain-containing protein [Armatimonadota bacterium]
MRSRSRLTTLAVAMIACAALLIPQAVAQNVQVTLDGEPMAFDSPVLMVDMVFPLLPAQRFLETLGASVTWDPAQQQLNASNGDVQLQMVVGQDTATVNGEQQALEYGLQTFSGQPYVPPAAAMLLGYDAQWDPQTLLLQITSPARAEPAETLEATLLEVVQAEEPASLLVRTFDPVQVGQIPLEAGANVRRGREGTAPALAEVADLQPGDLLELGVGEAGSVNSVRASFTQQVGTIAEVRGNQLLMQGGDTYPLGEGVQARGSDGTPLHLLGTEGEAVILRLSPRTGEVWGILAQRRGDPSPPETDQPRIAAFFVPEYGRALGAGQTMRLAVHGSGGGTATVLMAPAGTQVPLTEASPGVYTGAFTVPDGMELAGTRLTTRLQVGRNTVEARSNVAVTVDTSPPRMYNLTPPPDAVLREAAPAIGASYQDVGPAGIDLQSVALAIDGQDVTGEAQVAATQVAWAAEQLADGAHNVSVQVADPAGNVAEQTWQFQVQAGGQIQALEHDAAGPLGEGATLTVTMQVAAAGRQASFSIEGLQENLTMEEQAANTYVGTYQVQAGDQVADARVTATFVAADGSVHQAAAPELVTINAPVQEAEFSITRPENGAQTGRRIRPAGTGPAGQRVRWAVEYRKLIVGGEVASGTARIRENGVWRTDEQVDLKVLLIGMADEYTLTAELLDDGGNVVEEESVKFTAREGEG